MGRPAKFDCDFCEKPMINGEEELPHGTLQWRQPNPLIKRAGSYIQWKLHSACWEQLKPLLTSKLGRPEKAKE